MRRRARPARPAAGAETPGPRRNPDGYGAPGCCLVSALVGLALLVFAAAAFFTSTSGCDDDDGARCSGRTAPTVESASEPV